MIPPEKVANSVLKLLGIQDQFTHTTLSIGPLYPHTILELVPNTVPAPAFCPELPITVRMDLLFDEQVLVNTLSTGRKINLVTKRPINLAIIQQFRAQVLSYAHEITPGIDEPPVPYADAIKSLLPSNHAFFTRETDPKKVSDLRFTYFDHVTIGIQRDATKDEWVTSVLVYLNRPDTPENRIDIVNQLIQNRIKLKSNRYILSANQAFLSYAHLAANKPIASMTDNTTQVIDDPALFKDAQHFLFTQHV